MWAGGALGAFITMAKASAQLERLSLGAGTGREPLPCPGWGAGTAAGRQCKTSCEAEPSSNPRQVTPSSPSEGLHTPRSHSCSLPPAVHTFGM